MFDSHIHTKFSSDSKLTIEEALSKSNQLNVGIILTEHMDLNYPDSEKFRFDCDSYFREYEKYKSDKLLLGVEIGMNKEYSMDNKAIVSKYDFDYVLGSLHFLGNNDIYYPETYEGKGKKEVYENYFLEMWENLLIHEYIDCLGHIDYICRYAIYEEKNIKYCDYKIYIDQVLNVLVSKGIAMEINTRRLGDKTAISDLTSIYRRYSELGGKYVVLGSDSHDINSIAYKFKEGKELAEHCGLKSIYFNKRKPEYSY